MGLFRTIVEIWRVTWDHMIQPTLTTKSERCLWTSGWAVSGLVGLLFGPLAWLVVTGLTLVGWWAGYLYGERQMSQRSRELLRSVDEGGVEPPRDEPTGA